MTSDPVDAGTRSSRARASFVPRTRHTTPRSLTHPVVTKQTPERGGSPVAGLGPLPQDEPCRPPRTSWPGGRPLRSPPPASPTTSTSAARAPVSSCSGMPGMTPRVMGLANHLVGEGFTVAVPSLFGEPGGEVSAGYALRTISKACITREFAAFARGADRPIAEYVRPWRGICTRSSVAGGRCHRDVLQRRLRAGRRGRARRPRAGGQPALRAVPPGQGPEGPGDVRARADSHRRARAHRGAVPDRAAVLPGRDVTGEAVHRIGDGVRSGLVDALVFTIDDTLDWATRARPQGPGRTEPRRFALAAVQATVAAMAP